MGECGAHTAELAPVFEPSLFTRSVLETERGGEGGKYNIYHFPWYNFFFWAPLVFC